MGWLVLIGAGLTSGGFLLVIWCIIAAVKLRRSALDDAALRAQLAKLAPLNLGALFLSAFGLMMVVVGIALG